MNISENFASLCGKASNAASAAKKKATIVAGIAKANVSIYAEEDKIKKAEAELGLLYYNDYIAGTGVDQEAYAPVCKRITDSKDVIASLKEAIAELKAQLGGEGGLSVDVEVTLDTDIVADEEDFAVPEEAPEAAAETETAPEDPSV